MRYIYSTKMEGIEFVCTAKAIDDGVEESPLAIAQGRGELAKGTGG